jgi:hypothetical protein
MFDFYLRYGLAVSVVVVFTLVPLIAVLQARVVVRLRRDHHTTWQDLGSPTPIAIHPRHAWSLNRFLWQRSYRPISDARLGRLCRLTNGVTLIYVAFLVLGLAWPLVVLGSR